MIFRLCTGILLRFVSFHSNFFVLQRLRRLSSGSLRHQMRFCFPIGPFSVYPFNVPFSNERGEYRFVLFFSPSSASIKGFIVNLLIGLVFPKNILFVT